MLRLIVLTLFVLAAVQTQAQNYFKQWPAGTSPQEVGRRAAENFVARKLEVEDGKRKYVIYPEVCAWYGSLTVAQLTNDQDLRKRVVEKFDPLLAEHAQWIPPDAHVDMRVFGLVPLEIYLQTHSQGISIWAAGSPTISGTRQLPMASLPKRATGLTTCT